MIGFIQAINQSSLGWLQGNVEGELPQPLYTSENNCITSQFSWTLYDSHISESHKDSPSVVTTSANQESQYLLTPYNNKGPKLVATIRDYCVKSNRNLSHLWCCNWNQFKQTFRKKMEKLTSVFPGEIFPAGLMSIVLFLHLEHPNLITIWPNFIMVAVQDQKETVNLTWKTTASSRRWSIVKAKATSVWHARSYTHISWIGLTEL